MRYCDLTLAYTASSGGIRTYIDAKREYLHRRGADEHVLLIPAEEDSTERADRLLTRTLASPVIPGCAPYRFFWRPDVLLDALEETQPDIVELGSFFMCPSVAFDYRERRRAQGHPCLVSAYFHTDVADAYFGATVRRVVGKWLEGYSADLAQWCGGVAEALERSAEQYFGTIFQQCDVIFAATEAQRERLGKYGVERAEIVPLGVDLSVFHPNRRSAAVRRGLFDAAPDDVVILYAGRLDQEKHVDVLIDAFAACRLPNARLVLTGEGPMREQLEAAAGELAGVVVLPYERDRAAFATLLASADIYATAGPHETFGLSVIEAQASGLPVVGVNAGALPERVVPGTGLLSAVGDSTAMARNLERAAEQCRDLGTAARRHVVDSGFGWEATFEKLFGVYARRWAALYGQPD